MGETMGYGLVALVAALVAGSVGFCLGAIFGAAKAADVDRDAEARRLVLPAAWDAHPSNYRRGLRVVENEQG